MKSKVRITAVPTGPGTLNESTGEVTYPEPELIYYGPAGITGQISERQISPGGAPATIDETEVKIIDKTQGVQVGHIVTVTEDLDRDLVGTMYKVIRISRDTTELSRRLITSRIEAYPSPLGAA
jgi:hypothetical protein